MWAVVVVDRAGRAKAELTTDNQLSGAVAFAAGWNARGNVVSDSVAIVVDTEHAKQLLADSIGDQASFG